MGIQHTLTTILLVGKLTKHITGKHAWKRGVIASWPYLSILFRKELIQETETQNTHVPFAFLKR